MRRVSSGAICVILCLIFCLSLAGPAGGVISPIIRPSITPITPITPITSIPTIPKYVPPPPLAPTNLVADGRSGHLLLTWVDNSDNETGFKIERKKYYGDDTFKDLASVSNVSTYTDADIEAGVPYTYRVRAYYGETYSSYSNEATDQTYAISGGIGPAPDYGTLPKDGGILGRTTVQNIVTDPNGTLSTDQTPQVSTFSLVPILPRLNTSLYANAVSSSQVVLTWNDNYKNESGFKIERRAGQGPFTEISTVAANTTSYSDMNLKLYTIPGLSLGPVYTYRVRAYGGLGASNYSNESGPVILRFYLNSYNYYNNDQRLVMDTMPALNEGRIYLPLSYVAGPMGAITTWDASQQKITIKRGTKVIELWVGSNTALINGTAAQIDSSNPNVVPYMVPPGRIMLPLRFVAEAMDCRVEWDASTSGIAVVGGKAQ